MAKSTGKGIADACRQLNVGESVYQYYKEGMNRG